MTSQSQGGRGPHNLLHINISGMVLHQRGVPTPLWPQVSPFAHIGAICGKYNFGKYNIFPQTWWNHVGWGMVKACLYYESISVDHNMGSLCNYLDIKENEKLTSSCSLLFCFVYVWSMWGLHVDYIIRTVGHVWCDGHFCSWAFANNVKSM